MKKTEGCCKNIVSSFRFYYFLLLSFIAGFIILALEVVAARSLAPVIGSGSIVWSILLSIALGSLACGNLIGGLLSHRSDGRRLLMVVCLVSAAALVLWSQYYSRVLCALADVPFVPGIVVGALLNQALPIFMMGMITPLLLKQGPMIRQPGVWEGLVLATGSLGGITGALMSGLVLIPGFGLSQSYLILAILLITVVIPLLIHRQRWTNSWGFVLPGILLAFGWLSPGEPCVRQSLYGQVEIRRTPEGPALFIEGLQQTMFGSGNIRPWEAMKRGYWLEAAFCFHTNIQHVLVVGLGAALAPRLLKKHNVQCLCVEQDPVVVELARHPFGYSGPVTVSDGRVFLIGAREAWDLIFVDVCTSEKLAWHLFSLEAFRLLRERMAPEGILVVQFIGDQGPWTESVVQTIQSVFPHVCLIEPQDKTTRGVEPAWIFGSITKRLETLRPDQEAKLRDALVAAHCRIVCPAISAVPRILTDDHFSAEWDWMNTAFRWRQSSRFTAGNF